jgi:pyruvate ferredoxin oxidoreductase delta subunit
MPNPKVRPFVRPSSPKEYPVGPCFTAGHLVETNASWRSERPLVTAQLCTG